MSRPLRIEYPGAWYHVMNRDRRAETIFSDQEDYTMFVELLKEASVSWNIHICAYCLMPNHYHLLIQTPEGKISRCMRHINGIYTQRYNQRHGCDGQLLRGRYKSILVSADPYLLQLVRYIHWNPVKAGIAARLEDYQWTSHAAYLSLRRETLKDIGGRFRMERDSSVSSVIERLRERMRQDRGLRKRMDGLYRMLNKSQEET